MIRRLRWKVVGLNMGMVFCVLLAVFAAVFFFARSALSRSVRQQMEEAVRTGVYDLSQPDGSTLPCFVAEVYASGTVRVSGNGYYDLTDKSALADIVTAALSAQLCAQRCGDAAGGPCVAAAEAVPVRCQP